MKLTIVIPPWCRSAWAWLLELLRRLGWIKPAESAPMLLGRPDDESELGELNKAVRDLPRMSPEELEAHPAFQAPGDLRPGEYRSKSGAVIYPDSEVMTSYIGSAQEELDAREAARLARFPRAPKATGPTTCDQCLGWGWIGTRKCERCKGKGSL